MSHLPPQPCSQVRILFLLSDVSSLTGFNNPATVALCLLCLYFLLLAVMQGAIAISQTQVCVV